MRPNVGIAPKADLCPRCISVGAGYVARLARPGGNVTGFTAFEYSLSGKWLELFKEIAPNLTRIAILRDPAIAAGIGQFAVFRPHSLPNRRPLEISAENIEIGADVHTIGHPLGKNWTYTKGIVSSVPGDGKSLTPTRAVDYRSAKLPIPTR